MRLWRGQIPARFHINVVNKLRYKKSPEWVYEQILSEKLVRENKHKKGK